MTCPAEPASYPSRILLVVTGLSPHVLTETLFALAVQRTPLFRPTRIEVLTTAEGAARARTQLLDPPTEAFRRLCDEYALDDVRGAFGPRSIRTMVRPDGTPIADILDEADNLAAADTIIDAVRGLTADEASALHVSIAGGRKTMGFLAGHALSLYGRPQDRLSHVMVDDAFLSNPDYYYPPRDPRTIRDPRTGRPVPTSAARLSLAEIPFLRLRGHLPPPLLSGRERYSDLVGQVQAALEPSLEVALARGAVIAGGRPVPMPPAELGWMAWMAWRRTRRDLPFEGAVRWTEVEPDEVLRFHRAADPRGIGPGRSASALAGGMTKELFEQRTAKVNKLVRRALGLAAHPYLLSPFGRRPTTRIGLRVSPEKIRIHDDVTP